MTTHLLAVMRLLTTLAAVALPLLAAAQCTPYARREWSALSLSERRAYIDATLCMSKLPPKTDLALVPGAQSRWDDFIVVHINNTLVMHLDGIFLSWHRNYVWLWEKALQEECGYEGGVPYWNWPLYSSDLAGSPLFDGSDTSLSGNGVFDPDQGDYEVGGGGVLPHGTGGGCVTSGPFVNTTVSFGPFAFGVVFTGLPANWTTYSPHCLTRDLNDYVANRYTNQTDVDAVLATTTIGDFQDIMSGADINLGVHGGGHLAIGGAGFDFFGSPADPAFWLHHSMIDRVWTLWQEMDPVGRTTQLNGTSTIFNGNSTPEVTLDTVQQWGILGREKETRELVALPGGDFCYFYV